MNTTMMRFAGVAGAGAMVVATMTGCGSGSKSPAASSASATSSSSSASSSSAAQPTDYTGLLIKETDINAPEAFTARPPVANPNGQPGVAGSFSNLDSSHVVLDTILVLPDPAAAAKALDAAKAGLGSTVSGTPGSAPIGSGGTTVSGNSPDGSKSVTVLLFTQGRAFATLQFDGPVNAAAPSDFVTDVGQKQVAAIKTGLTG
jgi:hypothetical protein